MRMLVTACQSRGFRAGAAHRSATRRAARRGPEIIGRIVLAVGALLLMRKSNYLDVCLVIPGLAITLVQARGQTTSPRADSGHMTTMAFCARCHADGLRVAVLRAPRTSHCCRAMTTEWVGASTWTGSARMRKSTLRPEYADHRCHRARSR